MLWYVLFTKSFSRQLSVVVPIVLTREITRYLSTTIFFVSMYSPAWNL